MHVDRGFFDELVESAVPASYSEKHFEDYTDSDRWKHACHRSDVVVQMDPDRDHHLHRMERKAIQLGLRRKKLRQYALNEIVHIEDITAFVKQQHKYIKEKEYDRVKLPEQEIYCSKQKSQLS